ncbi:MAG: tRNA epoxyqueuosine(34) reductase QueG [Elusimicrobiales bacterium]|nr:tRNA epoxyqueuosine(34) reductase QueG [Elusimicrobiales bacterium]
MDAAARIKAIALAAGASAAGIAQAGNLDEFRRYSEAVTVIPSGLGYLKRDPLIRKSVKKWDAAARSVLVCSFRYWTPEMDHAAALAKAGPLTAFLWNSGRKPTQPALLSAPGAKISRYALCRDYHLVVKERLAEILAGIKKEFPDAAGKTFCDTSPLMEKELARLAGLGFRGKNTLLLSRTQGSYIFLGGISLNLALAADTPSEDSCGRCEQCVKACPTRALKDGRLDAGRCLAYWTTQGKDKMPEEAAARAGGWAYGCDICQEACPNNKAPGKVSPGFEPLSK